MLNANRWSWGRGLAAWCSLAAGALVLGGGCFVEADDERVGGADDSIDLATCATYTDTFTCRPKKPTKKECNPKGLKDGAGWDACKWKPKPATAENCPTDPATSCPAPPEGGCIQAIFGRLKDTKPYTGCPGYIVINLPAADWTQDKNDLYEDCLLAGMIDNLCSPPLKFVSKTADIPDYAAPDASKKLRPGEITGREICRAKVCHECDLKGRKGGGYVPEGCKHFAPPPKKGGRLKNTGVRQSTSGAGLCSIPEYSCTPCTTCDESPWESFEEDAIASWAVEGSGGGVGDSGGFGVGGVGNSGGFGGVGGMSSSVGVGGSDGVGGGVGVGGSDGVGGGPSCEPPADEDGDLCGNCNPDGATEGDGICEVGETGDDCACDY